MAFGEVRVNPYLDSAVVVDAHEILFRPKVPYEMKQFFEAVESAEEDVEILGIGDVLDVAEPNWDVLEIDCGTMVAVAKLLGLFCVHELGVDYVVLPFAPLEKLEVLLVPGVIVEVYLVLLHLLVGEVVAEELEEPVLGA